MYQKIFLLDVVINEKIQHTYIEIYNPRPMTQWGQSEWIAYIQPVLENLYPESKLRRIISPPIVIDDPSTFNIKLIIVFDGKRPVVEQHITSFD